MSRKIQVVQEKLCRTTKMTQFFIFFKKYSQKVRTFQKKYYYCIRNLLIVMSNLGYGAYPTHPGEVLKDEIESRGISQRQLADSMGLTYSVVNEILNGRRSLTAKTALMFEAALDVPADSLMYLQMKYNMQTAKNDKSFLNVLKGVRKVAAVL